MQTRNILINQITAYVAEAIFCGYSKYKSYEIYSHHGRLSIVYQDKEVFFANSDEVIAFIYQEQQLAC